MVVSVLLVHFVKVMLENRNILSERDCYSDIYVSQVVQSFNRSVVQSFSRHFVISSFRHSISNKRDSVKLPSRQFTGLTNEFLAKTHKLLEASGG